MAKPESPIGINNFQEASNATIPIISRRTFLKGAGVSLAAVGLAALGVRPAYAETTTNTNIQTQEGQRSTTNNTSEASYEPTALDTVKETTALAAANFLIGTGLDRVGIRNGNVQLAGEYERVKSKTEAIHLTKLQIAAGLLLTMVGQPTSEEAIFRFLPNLLLPTDRRDPIWQAGIPSSLVFAYLHNITRDSEGEPRLETKSIPVQQFTAGLYYWKTIRERGFWHSALSHSVYNAEALTGSIAFAKLKQVIGRRKNLNK